MKHCYVVAGITGWHAAGALAATVGHPLGLVPVVSGGVLAAYAAVIPERLRPTADLRVYRVQYESRSERVAVRVGNAVWSLPGAALFGGALALGLAYPGWSLWPALAVLSGYAGAVLAGSLDKVGAPLFWPWAGVVRARLYSPGARVETWLMPAAFMILAARLACAAAQVEPSFPLTVLF